MCRRVLSISASYFLLRYLFTRDERGADKERGKTEKCCLLLCSVQVIESDHREERKRKRGKGGGEEAVCLQLQAHTTGFYVYFTLYHFIASGSAEKDSGVKKKRKRGEEK